MTLSAVVFDMDGLMIDTEPLYKEAWQGASAELGYVLDDHSYVRLVGRPTPDCERELLAQFGSDFPMERFRARWPELWHRLIEVKSIQRKPGLLELLAFLEARALPLAVATSSDAEHVGLSLRYAGLDGRFPIVVTGDEVARGKPAPDIYLEAARRLGAAPAACLALEDSEAGIVAASRAGMRAVLIPDGTQPSDAAVQAAFRVLPSLREVPALVTGWLTP